MMLIRTNQTKPTLTPLSAAEQWLEDNPHRKAENMTGKMASDKDATRQYRNPTHLFDKDRTTPKPATKKPLLVAKQSNKVTKFNQDLVMFGRRLEAGQLVKFSDPIFKGRSKQTVFLMIKKLRESHYDLIAISGPNKQAIGWMLQNKLEDAVNG